MAVSQGLFKAEGLDVKLQTLAGGAEAIPKLKGGSLDISSGNYVSFLGADATGTLDLKIVVDGFASGPKSHVIMVPKDSTIQTPADLKDKIVAVNTKRNVASMLVRVAAKAHGVELDEDKNFVEFPFPEMEGALQNKKVDAAQVVEPFGTQIAQKIGARIIWDTSQGPTNEFPISGYAAASEFAAENPKTIAAFQRAMAKAQALAADRAEVVKTIPTYTTIPADVAGSLNIGVFPTTLNATRLQRVADSMLEYGLLDSQLNVQDVIVAAAPAAG
ncbi:sulfonate ABC transporter substrate-binding protein [Microtetraspora sp. NBRC 13810]|nr:sulfonate ABC transporter substrate-binding protein [Microtetraspora sp. NBRC 13810]